MSNKEQRSDFIPIIPFNHEVFEEITGRTKNDLENRPGTISRQFQIRSLLYVTFNTYLTKIISALPEEQVLEIIDELESVNDGREALEKISAKLNKTSEEIINNYLVLFGNKSN